MYKRVAKARKDTASRISTKNRYRNIAEMFASSKNTGNSLSTSSVDTMPALSCASVDTGENTQSQVREIVAEPNLSVTPDQSDVTASPRNEDETASLTQSTSGSSEMETTQLSSTIIRDGEVLSPHVLSSAAAKSALDASTPSSSHQSASNLTLPQEPFQPRFFDFPLKVYGNRQRFFLPAWFDSFKWPHYTAKSASNLHDFVTCYVCNQAMKRNLFSPAQRIEKAFLEGFNNWKKCPNAFSKHENTDQHKSASNALRNIERASIAVAISSAVEQQQAESRKALLAIFETVKYLARQGLAMQGHTKDEGNFIQLLKLRSGDIPELKQWLKRRDNWLSNHIQNEIVDLLGNAVLEKVVATVKNKEFYSCLADGTQDVTTQEQLSVVFRVVNDQFQAYDIFAGFVSLNATDGQTIATSLKNITFQLGIDFKKCRGLGFDGASNSSGALQGAQALLRREYPFAHYFHCANHRLDLVLQEVAREERLVRDALELARKTANFVKESHKRLQEYKHVCADIQNSVVMEGNENMSQSFSNLATICPTRWAVRVNGINSILKNLPALLTVFQKIANDSSYSVDARAMVEGLLKKLQKFETVLGLCIARDVFQVCEHLATRLQNPNNSINAAYQTISILREQLGSMRCQTNFETLYN